MCARIPRPRRHEVAKLAFGGIMAVHLHECHAEPTSRVVEIGAQSQRLRVTFRRVSGPAPLHQRISDVTVHFAVGGLAGCW
jgi:hypothetical protein